MRNIDAPDDERVSGLEPVKVEAMTDAERERGRRFLEGLAIIEIESCGRSFRRIGREGRS